MRNERMAAARSVADCLNAFENALDEAVALGSALSSQIVRARLEARLSAVIGQDAIEGALRTLTLLGDARRELVGTHHHLKSCADQIGLREVSFGDLLKPPSSAAPEAPRLQRVA
jgi:hypothetical protein